MKVNLIWISWVLLTGISCSSTSKKKYMTIEKVSPVSHMDDSSPVFSGNVDVTMLFTEHDPSKLTGANVTFKNKARSAWHTHPKGQILVVTNGRGYVQQWGEPAREMKRGDVVWTPPGVKHWHGACEKESVTHLALQEKNNAGKNVNWLEKVSDEQYKAAATQVGK